MATSSINSDIPIKNASTTRSAKRPPNSSPDMQLTRFLYLNEPKLTYTTGNPEVHGHLKRENLSCIGDLLQSDCPYRTNMFFNIIATVSADDALPRRDNLYFALALALTSDFTNPVINQRIYKTLQKITKCDAEYFTFIRYFTMAGKRNLPSGLNKSITRFYRTKDPMQLANDSILFQGYRGWKHSDLIKLSHMKMDADHFHQGSIMVLTYLLYGLEKVNFNAIPSTECQKVSKLLIDASEYRKSNDENKILKLLPALPTFTHLQLSPNLHKSFSIWDVIYDRLTLQELLNKLLFFYKCDFFQREVFLKKIIERVTNVKFITQSKIHPITVFITSKNLENGGKPKNPKLLLFLEKEEGQRLVRRIKPNFSFVKAIKCPTLVRALRKTLTLSYNNILSLGKCYMITIEVSENMSKGCLSNRGITCLEAAVIIAYSLYKSEKNVMIGVFDGKNINEITFETEWEFREAFAKVKDAAHGYVAYGQPIHWASARKKKVDVFLNLMYNVIPRQLPKGVICNPSGPLKKYHEKLSPKTKLILHSLGCASGNYYESRHNYILNLHGFDESISPVISAFVTDKF